MDIYIWRTQNFTQSLSVHSSRCAQYKHVGSHKLKLIIIIIKRISRAPIYRTRWEHRAFYNNTDNTHLSLIHI